MVLESEENSIEKKEKIVYVPMAVDFIHIGHINIIKKAKELGKVVIGLLSDEAIAKYKQLPFLDCEQRKAIMESIGDVDEVIIQKTWDYEPILRKLRPDYVVHGDDWKTGIQKEKREQVIKILEEWGGKLVEPAYDQEVPPEINGKELKRLASRPEFRRKKLRRLLQAKQLIRVIESHNGLSALIAENMKVPNGNEMEKEFDAIWISSLTDSTAKGKPDIEVVDPSSRLNTIEQILEVTTKPLIVDGDTGGITEHFIYLVRTLERLGVSAVIIEDKVGLKRNSLFGTEVPQTQDSIENFSYKVSEGKKAQFSNSFMIIARIESLILKKGLWDALLRARAYIEAGADGIMVSYKDKDTKELIDFCKEYQKFEQRVPLVLVPSTYSHIRESELREVGANIVIYANNLLRSAYPAMMKTAESILINERAKEAEEYCLPINEVIRLIPGGK